jgi:hypothetical protein
MARWPSPRYRDRVAGMTGALASPCNRDATDGAKSASLPFAGGFGTMLVEKFRRFRPTVAI